MGAAGGAILRLIIGLIGDWFRSETKRTDYDAEYRNREYNNHK